MPEYLHQEPGTEVRFIAGHYAIVEERRIAHRGRNSFLSSYRRRRDHLLRARVPFSECPGYVVAWKHRLTENGLPVSEVEPVEDEKEQAESGRSWRVNSYSQISSRRDLRRTGMAHYRDPKHVSPQGRWSTFLSCRYYDYVLKLLDDIEYLQMLLGNSLTTAIARINSTCAGNTARCSRASEKMKRVLG